MWGKKEKKRKTLVQRNLCNSCSTLHSSKNNNNLLCDLFIYVISYLLIYFFFHFFPSERRRGRGCHSCPITLARGHMSFVVDNKTPSRHRRLRLLVFFKNSAVSPHLYLYIHTYTPFIFVFFQTIQNIYIHLLH